MKQIILLALAAAAASAQAASPYISKVFEYSPAPGQFVNLLPEYSAGDTAADMADKAGECLVGDRNPGAISLGAFGGYVVFGFDHTIVNVPGEYDLRILGNAVISDRDSNGGSCEPGIVYVMRDENGNSLPDDTWYELAGAEYNAETTRHNFTVTYTRPAAGHAPTPSADSKHITDTTYIPWTASDGTTGYIEKTTITTRVTGPNGLPPNRSLSPASAWATISMT